MKRNVNELLDFIEWFEEQPEEDYSQESWYNMCGTPACIGGHMERYMYLCDLPGGTIAMFDHFGIHEVVHDAGTLFAQDPRCMVTEGYDRVPACDDPALEVTKAQAIACLKLYAEGKSARASWAEALGLD